MGANESGLKAAEQDLKEFTLEQQSRETRKAAAAAAPRHRNRGLAAITLFAIPLFAQVYARQRAGRASDGRRDKNTFAGKL